MTNAHEKVPLRRGTIMCALIAVALAAAGCQSRYQDLCQRASDKCAKGNEKDVEACTVQLETQEDVAVAWECEPEWDDFVSCFESHGECDKDDGWEPKKSCDDEEKKVRKCECDDWDSKEGTCKD